MWAKAVWRVLIAYIQKLQGNVAIGTRGTKVIFGETRTKIVSLKKETAGVFSGSS